MLSASSAFEAAVQGLNPNHDSDINKIELLLTCVEAICEQNVDQVVTLLEKLLFFSTSAATPSERLVFYFMEALWEFSHGIFVFSKKYEYIYSQLREKQLYEHSDRKKLDSALRAFRQISPILMFSDLTGQSNILETFKNEKRVHIIDFDIRDGVRWHTLLQQLATRQEGAPSHIRITGMGSSMELLEETRSGLFTLAEELNISVEFVPVVENRGNLNDQHLGVEPTFPYVIHWPKHLLYDDDTWSDMDKLDLLGRLSPKLLTVVEKTFEKEGPFPDRFLSALYYFAGLLDSLYTAPEEKRDLVEKQLLWREIRSCIVIGKYSNIGDNLKSMRSMYLESQLPEEVFPIPGNNLDYEYWFGKKLSDNCGTTALRWKDKAMVHVSAWKPPAVEFPTPIEHAHGQCSGSKLKGLKR